MFSFIVFLREPFFYYGILKNKIQLEHHCVKGTSHIIQLEMSLMMMTAELP